MVKSEKFFKLRITNCELQITIYEFHQILTVIQPTTDKPATDSQFFIFNFHFFFIS